MSNNPIGTSIESDTFDFRLLFLVLWICCTPATAKEKQVVFSASDEVNKSLQVVEMQEALIKEKETIKAANKFMSMFLRGQDDYDPEIEDEWKSKFGMLINMSGKEWQQFDQKQWQAYFVDSNNNQIDPLSSHGIPIWGANFLVCPAVKLVGVKRSNNGFILNYQMPIVGRYIEQKSFDGFRAKQMYELAVEFDQNKKFVRFLTSEKFRPSLYVSLTKALKQSIRASGSASVPIEHAERDKRLIKDIEKAAYIVCK